MTSQRLKTSLSYAFLLSTFVAAMPSQGWAYCQVGIPCGQMSIIRPSQTEAQTNVARTLDQINQIGHSTAFENDYRDFFNQANSNRDQHYRTLQSLLPTTSFMGIGAVNNAGAMQEANIMGHLRDIRAMGSSMNFADTRADVLPGTQKTYRSPAMVVNSAAGSMYDPETYENLPRTAAETTTPRRIAYAGQPLAGSARSIFKTTGASVPVAAQEKYGVVSTNSGSGIDSSSVGQPAGSARSNPAPVYGSMAVPMSGKSGSAGDRRWGMFVTTNGVFGSQEIMKSTPSANNNGAGMTAGVDYRVAKNTFVGMALSYAYNNFSVDGQGTLDGSSYTLSLYGTTKYLKNAYLDGFVGASYHDFDASRTIYTPISYRSVASNNEAFGFTGRVETGYDFHSKSGWKYGPYVGISSIYAGFLDATESGDSTTMRLNVDHFHTYSLLGNVGFGATKRFRLDDGGTITPGMRLAYNREMGPSHATVTSSFVEAQNIRFRTAGANVSRDFMSLNPTVSAQLANNWTFQAAYGRDFFRDNITENLFNVAAQYRW